MNELFWVIVYPRGNRSQLSIAELCDSTEHEMDDYDLASRNKYRDKEECVNRAKHLANENGLVYVGDKNQPHYLE